jgi:hypothetical protein
MRILCFGRFNGCTQGGTDAAKWLKSGGYKKQHWRHRNTATKVLHSFVFTRWLLCCQIQYLLFILLVAAFYLVVKYDQTAKSVITDLGRKMN